MRILLVAPHFAKYNKILFDELAKRVNVRAIYSPQNYKNEVGDSQIELHDFVDSASIRRPVRLVQSIFKLVNLYRKYQPNIVHIHETQSESFNIWILFFVWRPIVLTVHDVSPHPGSDSNINIRQKAYKNLLRFKAKRIIVHGEKLREYYLRIAKFSNPYQVVTIHHPCFFPTVTLNRVSHDVVLMKKSYRFLFFGRMERYKGLDMFPKILDMLGHDRNRIELVIAGTGVELNKYEKCLSSYDNVTIINEYVEQAKLEYLIHKSDVIITPYIEGSQSGVIAYAIGFSKPIITTNVGSIPEVAIHQRNAIVVEVGDVISVVDAIRKILNNPETIVQMSAEAMQVGSTIMSPSSIAAKTINEVYNRVFF